MKLIRRTILVACTTVSFLLPAQADDSSASLGAGGLVLTQSADIRMAAEDLYISPKQVRIRFEFVNDSARDIDTVVAFPLPDIDNYRFWGEPIGRVTEDPLNFVGFEVIAEGKHVPVTVEQRAVFENRDVTAIVKAARAPLNTVVDRKALDALPKGNLNALLRAGLIERDGDNIIAKWIVRTKFYWQQRFAAGRKTVLEERYQPVTGQSFFSEYELNGRNPESGRYYEQNFCIDRATRSAIAARLAVSKKTASESAGLLSAFTTDYVLVTGNNWKGPIGRFHLTVDKLHPDSILSMCWDGDLKKTAPTTFEATRENFSPARDIRLLVLTSTPPPD